MKKFLKINNKITINKNQNKSELRFIINWFTQNYGSLRTNKLVDNLKKVGFNYSTKAGISLGIEDLLIPNIKKDLLKISEKKLGKLNANEKKGYVNPILYMEKVVQTWDQTNEKLREEIINTFRQTNIINPLYMMTFSGARGNISQIKQLVGMRGLISDSQGEILNIPIKNNFKEGLNLVEYFISCYGARKGLVDTALKTANSGYLTRRLIYSSQNIIIKQPNCKTNYKTLVLVLKSNKNSYKTIKASLLGRILARNIKSLNNEKIIASEGQDICNFILKRVIKTQKIYIRSPLNCIINNGICQLCYGWNLGNGRIAELGESIGIVAAQSIGEPGTQLTMRTFHTGGVFSGETNRIITAPHKGKINYVVKDNHKRIYNKYSEKITVLNKETLISISKNNNQGSIIKLPAKSIIFPKPGKKLSYRQLIAEIPINKTRQQIATESKEIKAPFSGLVVFNRQQNKMSIISCNLLGSKDFYNFYKKKNETKIKLIIIISANLSFSK
jgi:DNA-directed RNA polymerase subunit beta'